MKDNFSKVSASYAQFRPHYPIAFFDFIYNHVPDFRLAWDCGTGTGQVANILAEKFEKVFATDISSNQLKNAIRKQNIIYKEERAEETEFPDKCFDLILVAQAIHWFNFEKFYAEVNRTLQPEGLIAVIGYSLIRVNKQVDAIIDAFYTQTLHSYWDAERRYIDEEYQTIPFPYKEIKLPPYKMEYEWTLDQLIGFLNTWSGVQHFIDRNHFNPIPETEKELKTVWKENEKKVITFPLFARLGKIKM